MFKMCTKCKIVKSLNEFCVRSASPDGLALVCRTCAAEFKRQYYSIPANREKEKATKKRYRKANLEKKRIANTKWRKENTEKNRRQQNAWAKANRHVGKEWVRRNIERKREIAREYERRQRKDPFKRLNRNISTAIWRALKQEKKEKHWEIVVSFSFVQLKEHLESQFVVDMSWENYGSYWHIDHILPVSCFDFSDPTSFAVCWSLENLQPLRVMDNLQKGNKLDWKPR